MPYNGIRRILDCLSNTFTLFRLTPVSEIYVTFCVTIKISYISFKTLAHIIWNIINSLFLHTSFVVSEKIVCSYFREAITRNSGDDARQYLER